MTHNRRNWNELKKYRYMSLKMSNTQRLTRKWRSCLTEAPCDDGTHCVAELVPDGWRFHLCNFIDGNMQPVEGYEFDSLRCYWAPLPQSMPLNKIDSQFARECIFSED